ncbi:MAG TPA: hypothetical protein VGK84_05195 [Candidatus Tumulicola sp.]|jgi:hypothetical protein
MRNILSLLLTVAFVVAIVGRADAQCDVKAGARVALTSQADDPDVLLWDSRFRLRDYNAASFDVSRQLLPHARLVSQGTRATVESCVPDFVQLRLQSGSDDAIGIVITSGKYRGVRGWVLGTDLRSHH